MYNFTYACLPCRKFASQAVIGRVVGVEIAVVDSAEW